MNPGTNLRVSSIARLFLHQNQTPRPTISHKFLALERTSASGLIFGAALAMFAIAFAMRVNAQQPYPGTTSSPIAKPSPNHYPPPDAPPDVQEPPQNGYAPAHSAPQNQLPQYSQPQAPPQTQPQAQPQTEVDQQPQYQPQYAPPQAQPQTQPQPLTKSSSPNTRNPTRHNTPLRSSLMLSSRNTRRSHILISSQAARKRSRTHNQIKISRQRQR